MRAKKCPDFHPKRIREAWVLRFGLSEKYMRIEFFTYEHCQQLTECRSDEARRLLLGVSEKVTE